MKILFFPVDCCPFHGKTLEERPLGGTETAIIRLAEALDQLGQEVYVATGFDYPPMTKPKYVPVRQVKELGAADALIVVRGWKGCLLPIKRKKCFFWTGDSWDNPHAYGIGDRRIANVIDAFFAVSNWQAQSMCASSGFPLEKSYVLANGIKAEFFAGKEERRRKRLIYSSTPYRGLIFLPEIFMDLKRLHSEVELSIFSSVGVYSRTWPPIRPDEGQYAAIFERLSAIPGCHVYGGVRQDQLAREFMKSSILAYPCNYEETSCITAMEAQAAGCAIVTSDLAALPETVGDAGILIKEKIGTPAYHRKFIEACTQILNDDSLFHSLSQNGLNRAKQFDWKIRAEQLLKYLKEKHGL